MSADSPTLLYAAAARIQPRRASGRFQRLRVAAMLVLLGAYYGIPWLTWDGDPLVWFDLPHRRFHLAGLTLAPQDLILLSALLAVAALTLFLFTTLAGRLWCGYACPQTVWTEAFLWIEHLCEGDRHARLKLDRSPWTLRKLSRRGGKHVLWGLFAALTGLSFVAYFVPARELFPAALQGSLGGWALFWSVFYGFATWGNAGFMREQVCKYMCPYARFQSAMFDRDTLIIAYDRGRGEPRKGAVPLAALKDTAATTGDCIDCTLCVQVCPVGIDIRQGLQYECIACAACVDACDSVMDRVNKPRGLVRYTTAHRDQGRPTRLLRPRAIGYGLVWLAAMAGLALLLLHYTLLRLDVLRDRHTLVRERADGSLENLYVLKLSSAEARGRVLQVNAWIIDGPDLRVHPEQVESVAESTVAVPVTLRTPPEAHTLGLAPVVDVEIVLRDAQGVVRREARFLTRDLR